MIRSMTRFGLGIIVALTAAVLPLTARAVTYTAADTFDLHPFFLGTNSQSEAHGISGSQQVGSGSGGNTGGTGYNHALLWTSTAASVVDLNPDALLGTNSSSIAYGISGSQQVGSGSGGNTGGNNHAMLWTGTATSAVDLNPDAVLGTNSSSIAYGISGSQQVGSGSGGNTGGTGYSHALLWTGTAASVVDLNPAALLGTSSSSIAVAISGSQQVGSGFGENTGSLNHALLWTGTAASAVDLNPDALFGTNSYSVANGTSGSQQVGFGGGLTGNVAHALLWTGTAASAVDLNPDALLGGSSSSYAQATNGSQQVGQGNGGNTGGNAHALLWTGTAASAVDLNALLPAGTRASVATAIDAYGNIVGYATVGGFSAHAVEWLAGDLYTGPGGIWNNNWTAGNPTTGNDVLLIQSDSTNRLVNYPNSSPAVTLGQITIDATGTGTMMLSQVTNTLTSTSEIIGFLGTGTFNQTGGTHTVIGTMTLAAQAGSQGTYNLSSIGALHAGSILLNSGGTFNQTGGTLYAGTFTQAGGTVTGTLQNQGNFVYQSGAFSGRLLNQGTVNLGPNFTADNGVENDASMTLSAGQTLTVNGAGLDNLGIFTLNGGTVSGDGSALNDFGGTLLGYGTINPPLTNNGSLTVSGVLALNGGVANHGVIQGSGTVSGSLSNAADGMINVAAGSLLAITNPWSNSGGVALLGSGAALHGGAINNVGTIQGGGVVGNAVTNTGTIEPIGGTLFLTGTLLNPAGGLIRIGTGNKLLVTQGLLASAGIVNLTGGTFDNGGQPMNNLGQISGFGTFATGGTGLDNNGSVTLTGGLTTVNGPVTNENGKTIVVAYNPAIFTGLVTNNGGGTFNIVSTTAVFAGGSSGTFGGTFTNNANSAFSQGGSGTLEVDGAPTLGTASSLAVNDSSTLRFKATTGAATIGTGVTAMVNNGATLELAGSVSALSSGSSRVNITNNSSAAAGILVSGTHQQVGGIDGPGNVQVNAGASLTANHITAGALVIGGAAGSAALLTIDASDASGNPLDLGAGEQTADGTRSVPATLSSGLALAVSLQSSDSFAFGAPASSSLDPPSAEGFSGDPIPAGPGSGPTAVPEPSTLLLALLGLCGLAITARRAKTPV
jgi:hypothetical protein